MRQLKEPQAPLFGASFSTTVGYRGGTEAQEFVEHGECLTPKRTWPIRIISGHQTTQGYEAVVAAEKLLTWIKFRFDPQTYLFPPHDIEPTVQQ